MIRINALRNIAGPRDFITWGKNIEGDISAFVFAAVLIVCSITVGCSSEKPQPINSSNQIPVTQPQIPVASVPAPVMQAEAKPAPKKIVHKKPATVNYTDKTNGLTFEYSRRYAIETGNAASDLVASSPLPMNFVAPGGIALAAVELPQTNFANTDFSSAYFDVSVNKTLTAEQCNEFAVPQPKVAVAAPVEAASTASAASSEAQPAAPQSAPAATTASSEQSSAAKPSDAPTPAASTEPASGSKLLVGDLELRGTETVAGEGTRQSDSKYFHVYQNGACYEFALNVTTAASEEGMTKHVDRDRVFSRLEQILDTVKINPVAPEATAETPATPAAPETPAQ